MRKRRVVNVDAIAVQIPEAARMLGVSAKTVRRLVANNKLPFSKIGNRILIRIDEVQRVIREGSATR